MKLKSHLVYLVLLLPTRRQRCLLKWRKLSPSKVATILLQVILKQKKRITITKPDGGVENAGEAPGPRTLLVNRDLPMIRILVLAHDPVLIAVGIAAAVGAVEVVGEAAATDADRGPLPIRPILHALRVPRPLAVGLDPILGHQEAIPPTRRVRRTADLDDLAVGPGLRTHHILLGATIPHEVERVRDRRPTVTAQPEDAVGEEDTVRSQAPIPAIRRCFPTGAFDKVPIVRLALPQMRRSL